MKCSVSARKRHPSSRCDGQSHGSEAHPRGWDPFQWSFRGEVGSNWWSEENDGDPAVENRTKTQRTGALTLTSLPRVKSFPFVVDT